MKSLLELALTMRDEGDASRQALARLQVMQEAAVPVALEIERLRQRAEDFAQIEQLLTSLAPNERFVLTMIEVGGVMRVPPTMWPPAR